MFTLIVIVDGDVGGSLDIACVDGSAWTVQGNLPSVSVVACSRVFDSPTPAQTQTWGAVKSMYR